MIRNGRNTGRPAIPFPEFELREIWIVSEVGRDTWPRIEKRGMGQQYESENENYA